MKHEKIEIDEVDKAENLIAEIFNLCKTSEITPEEVELALRSSWCAYCLMNNMPIEESTETMQELIDEYVANHGEKYT